MKPVRSNTQVPNADGTARLAAADVDIVPLWDEWAGEGVTPIRPSDTFPLKGEGLRCESFLLRRAIPNTDGTACPVFFRAQLADVHAGKVSAL